MTRWRSLLVLLVAAAALPAAAAEPAAGVKIRAAYLYNFMKFVHWPARDQAEVQLCVLGNDALAAYAREALRDRVVGAQRVRVRAAAAGDDLRECWIVYAGPGAAAPPGLPSVLTVGEGRAFAEGGGMVAFTVVDDRVRFFVNLPALRDAGLAADAQMLSVALEVLQ